VFLIRPPPGTEDGTCHLGDVTHVLALPCGVQDTHEIMVFTFSYSFDGAGIIKPGNVVAVDVDKAAEGSGGDDALLLCCSVVLLVV